MDKNLRSAAQSALELRKLAEEAIDKAKKMYGQNLEDIEKSFQWLLAHNLLKALDTIAVYEEALKLILEGVELGDSDQIALRILRLAGIDTAAHEALSRGAQIWKANDPIS